MCTLTTLNVDILHSIIRHRHPAIIRSCYWRIMKPKGDFLPLPSYIYQFIIKSYILKEKKENFGISCLTNEKQYYVENCPEIVVESGSLDQVILMLTGGGR